MQKSIKFLTFLTLAIFLTTLVIAINTEQKNSNQVQNQNRVVVNNEGIETGEKTRLKTGDIEAETDLEIEEETEQNKTRNQTRLYVTLSNGRKAEIKVMPEKASERAKERLGELGFNITLKEIPVKNQTREELKLAYELEGEEPGRFLGLFKVKLKKQIQVDAETGQIISQKKPWYSFLVA